MDLVVESVVMLCNTKPNLLLGKWKVWLKSKGDGEIALVGPAGRERQINF